MIGGGILSPVISCKSGDGHPTVLTNWAGNISYSTSDVQYPNSLEQVRELILQLPSMRGLGSRHSFNTIADSKHHLISLKDINQILTLDKSAQTLTIEAGARYGDFCEYLHTEGFALPNLASLPHISVGGSCATATHGSGIANGVLATGVRALELIKANGEVLTISRDQDPELFNGVVVGLGGLGIVTKITLDLLPTFQMRQVVFRNMPMSALENNFNNIMGSGYSVSLFTDWRNRNVNEVWVKSKAEAFGPSAEDEFYGAVAAQHHMHPVESLSADSCTEQLGKVGPWYDRLPHFKMGFTPSSGKELQAEYFVPMEDGFKAIMAVEQLHEKISPNLFISEIRTIAADNYWMSPCYQKPCVAIHFTFKPKWDEVQKLLPLVEEALRPYNVRPHWGKLFSLNPKVLQSRIEKLSEFKELLAEMDPSGKFRNEFLKRNLY